jgi:hypothetical protein
MPLMSARGARRMSAFSVPVEIWHVTSVAYIPDSAVNWANSLPLAQ